MSTVLPASDGHGASDAGRDNPNLPWFIALAGFAAMYLPVYVWAAEGIWQSEEQGRNQGPGTKVFLHLARQVWISRRRAARRAPAV